MKTNQNLCMNHQVLELSFSHQQLEKKNNSCESIGSTVRLCKNKEVTSISTIDLNVDSDLNISSLDKDNPKYDDAVLYNSLLNAMRLMS